jgi:hypothetical protein
MAMSLEIVPKRDAKRLAARLHLPQVDFKAYRRRSFLAATF